MSTFGIVKHNIISVKKDASHRSEMVTQALFGETLIVLDTENEWTQIQLVSDGYIGWIMSSQYLSIPSLFSTAPFLVNKDWKTIKIGDQKIKLPLGARVWDKDQMKSIFGKIKNRASISSIPQHKTTTVKGVLKTAKHFLGTPYLWGGKSSVGIDCSGLSQISYALNGYQLPRDAYQQAEIGQTISFNQIQKGDLAFFKNADEKITHVGIIYKTSADYIQIIHSSGFVKIDQLDSKGIIHSDTKEYTHELAFIKRIIE